MGPLKRNDPRKNDVLSGRSQAKRNRKHFLNCLCLRSCGRIAGGSIWQCSAQEAPQSQSERRNSPSQGSEVAGSHELAAGSVYIMVRRHYRQIFEQVALRCPHYGLDPCPTRSAQDTATGVAIGRQPRSRVPCRQLCDINKQSLHLQTTPGILRK